MATRMMIIDDLTGDAGAETRTFSLEGVTYEIDLTDASFEELRELLKPYLVVARARRTGPSAGSVAATKRGKSPQGGSDSAAIRAWARSAGVTVTQRGRVPAHIRSAWEAAGSPG